MPKATRNLVAAVATAAAALLPAESAMAGERHQVRVNVQVTDYWQLSPADLANVEAEVATIYGRIGVDVVWTALDARENDAHTVAVVILSAEMGLRMIAAERVGDSVMGLALKAARRAYIFSHRVRAVSAKQGIDFQKLLAKVVAHEIGHLLRIGHSECGIMQPAVQVGSNAAEWFTPAQGAAIRAELAVAASSN